jgi:hypothetical protein
MQDPEDDESGLGDRVEFHIVFNEGGKALLLTRSDYEEGTMEYRSSGEWVQITSDDVIPILDENPLTRVEGGAVFLWDEISENASEEDFEDHILDK